MTDILGKSWREYQSKVLDPVGAGAVQRKETRIAFYMGAMCLLDEIMKALSGGDEITQADIDLMSNVQAEMQAFTKEMLGGRI